MDLKQPHRLLPYYRPFKVGGNDAEPHGGVGVLELMTRPMTRLTTPPFLD